MKILVTGSEGFVGKNVSNFLEEKGIHVIHTDINSSDINGDIKDENFVFNQLFGIDFDGIVHLAALANLRTTTSNPYLCYRTNSLGTLNMLELAKRKNVQKFVYASSANVYGSPSRVPVTEHSSLAPRLPYDHSKVIGEEFVRSYNRNHKLPTVILRSWKLFGEYDTMEAAIPRFIKACLKNEEISLFNGGRDTTDPYHIENYCNAIHLCLTHNKASGEIFNIGSGEEISIRSLAEYIKRILNAKSELKNLPPRSILESEPMRSYPSIAKIKNMLGYLEVIKFEEGIRRTIKWISNEKADMLALK